jgi:hypothetical protein
MMEIFYKCPECGDVTTKYEILEECGSGGLGMCYCEYDLDKTLIKWKRISRKEYIKLKLLKDINIVTINK